MPKNPSTKLDVKAIEEATGLPVTMGKVVSVNDRLYVSVGRSRQEIKGGEIFDAVDAAKLAGNDVPILQSGKTIVAIGGLRPCYWIICYLPVDAIIKRIRPELRKALIEQYMKQNVITPEIAKKLIANVGPKI